MKLNPEVKEIVVECFDIPWLRFGMCGGPRMNIELVGEFVTLCELQMGTVPAQFGGHTYEAVDWTKSHGNEGSGVCLTACDTWFDFLLCAADESERAANAILRKAHSQSEEFAVAERRTILVHRARRTIGQALAECNDA